MTNKIKPIAIYLPQFHPIPENDEWWGKGFTEWTNVTKSKPRFKGHYQPHLPSELGFYDLRVTEVRLAQEKLAKEHGIYGFCYYHYWFNGKKMLYEPLMRKLQNSAEDFPFMLCWANENWTRSWDGLENNMLLKQEYSVDDDINHMRYLCRTFFCDHRYIRHNGKIVFNVYRPKLFKDIKGTIENWRKVAIEEGIGELYLGYMQSWGVYDDPKDMGFDFAIEFQPKFPSQKVHKGKYAQKIDQLFNKIFGMKLTNNKPKHITYDYSEFTKLQMGNKFNPNVSPALVPMWDNSARKENAFTFKNESPEAYGVWLKFILENFPWEENNEKFLFINAWNEWAEGNHLEPCLKWGRKYLEVTKKSLADYEQQD